MVPTGRSFFFLSSIRIYEIYLSFFNLCGVRFSVQKGDMVKEGEKLNTLLSTSPEQKPAAGRGSALLARRPGTGLWLPGGRLGTHKNPRATERGASRDKLQQRFIRS